MFMLPKRSYRSLSRLFHCSFIAKIVTFSLPIMMFSVSILLKTQSFGFILVIVQLDTPEFEKVSTQEERKTFVEKLDEAVQDWLYMDGEDGNQFGGGSPPFQEED
ncbi:hypothetical protein Bca4012_029880 [Brassica carinata]